jgi:hypothetical protein
LETIIREFESARERLHALAQRVPDGRWTRRPDPARWSIAECIAHLNLTSRAYLPILRDGIARAQGSTDRARARYRRDPIGWLLWKVAGPPVRLRVKTTPPFVPAAAGPPGPLIAEFDRLQTEQVTMTRDADGLPLDRIKIASPFDARLKYSLYAALTILPRHQHRHLWQAERVLAART